jgi:hypothetical protein
VKDFFEDEDEREILVLRTPGNTLIVCGTLLILGSLAALCYEKSSLSSGGLMAMVAFLAGGMMIFLGFISGVPPTNK